MAKCPNCKEEVAKPAKEWEYATYVVKLYRCPCGNQFREYFREEKLRFILSAHNGGLGRTRVHK